MDADRDKGPDHTHWGVQKQENNEMQTEVVVWLTEAQCSLNCANKLKDQAMKADE